MIATKETVYTRNDANKSITAVREFDAPVALVWKAWSEPELLDQWWAPKPWKANTIEMSFKTGGAWRYYMEGPDGSRHYCRADYESVVPNKSFTGLDAFTDEKGNISNDMPRMKWNTAFAESGKKTKVEIVVSFDSLEDLEKIVEMGFKEGFAMAHGNLDELLASLQK
jgi:uncharacterized protein YndB with AHSA1/START domain